PSLALTCATTCRGRKQNRCSAPVRAGPLACIGGGKCRRARTPRFAPAHVPWGRPCVKSGPWLVLVQSAFQSASTHASSGSDPGVGERRRRTLPVERGRHDAARVAGALTARKETGRLRVHARRRVARDANRR